MAEHARFLVHLLPPSAAPDWLGWPRAAGSADPADGEGKPAEPPQVGAAPGRRADQRPPGGWYAWRLLSTNNRELARSAYRFAAVGSCRQAVAEVREGVARLVLSTFSYPATGQWSWGAELDGESVAAGRRYEHEQNARYAAKRFLDVVAGAEVAAAVRSLRDRRGPAPSRNIPGRDISARDISGRDIPGGDTVGGRP